MGVVTMTTTITMSFSTSKADIEEWLGIVGDDAKFHVTTTPGDRNESPTSKIVATWSSVASGKAR